MLSTVFVDAGGTLWPDVWPTRPRDDEERCARLREAIPGLGTPEGSRIVGALAAAVHPPGPLQQTDVLVTEALRQVQPAVEVPVAAVRAAMCLPARGHVELFPGARRLLAALAGRCIRVVIVSNALWRDAEACGRDFEDLGVASFVHSYVSSVDVGWRKPHRQFFDAALRLVAGSDPSMCALVGDSEVNDIVPAAARGVLAVRVAIEVPPPSTSAAAHVCTSLDEVLEVLLDAHMS